MILGFAHITQNVAGFDPGGNAIPNAPQKWPLMSGRAEHHVIDLQWRTARNAQGQAQGLPLETIQYDTGVVAHPGRLSVENNQIILSARSTSLERGWFRDGLEFVEMPNGSLQLNSHMPSWRVQVAVHADASAPIDPPLDIAGYAALAFYSTDLEIDTERLIRTHSPSSSTAR
jgi:hypothetical protein